MHCLGAIFLESKFEIQWLWHSLYKAECVCTWVVNLWVCVKESENSIHSPAFDEFLSFSFENFHVEAFSPGFPTRNSATVPKIALDFARESLFSVQSPK